MRAEFIAGGATGRHVQQILDWPAPLVLRLKELVLKEGQPQPDELAEAVRQGLRGGDGTLTPLGEDVRDILIHESWLNGDELTATIREGTPGAHEAVLDVGCSTGWMLRQMAAAPGVRRIGIDLDQAALALGHRLAVSEGKPISFRVCSAHALPFEDASFDWVICRNALTYMHQKTALAEMTRVLKPAGRMFIRFENPLYDLQCMLEARSPVMWLARIRDFVYGCAASTIGWQPMPGGLIRGSRTFSSLRRLRRLLRSGGCQITGVVECLRCPRVLGRPNQTAVMVSKRGITRAVDAAEEAQSATALAVNSWAA